MKKLGLQYTITADTFAKGDRLNIDQNYAMDRRPLLSRLEYDTNERHFFYFLSFASMGTVLDIVCTRAGGRDAGNDAAALYIPGGVYVHPSTLSDIVNAVKEQLLTAPEKRTPIAQSEYGRYFEQEYTENAVPIYPDPYSDNVAYMNYGPGTDFTTLVSVFSNLYRPAYSAYSTIILVNTAEKAKVPMSSGIKSLSTPSLAAPCILRDVVFTGSEAPEKIFVDGQKFTAGKPIFVKRNCKITLTHKGYDSIIVSCEVPADGRVQLGSLIWKVHIKPSDFIITSPSGDPLNATVSVNGTVLSENGVSFPADSATRVNVKISATGYQSVEKTCDLTSNTSRRVVLSRNKDSYKYFFTNTPDHLNGKLVLKVDDVEDMKKSISPLKGYRFSHEDARGHGWLTYNNFAFLKETAGIVALVAALLIGAFIGYAAGKHMNSGYKNEVVELGGEIDSTDTDDALEFAPMDTIVAIEAPENGTDAQAEPTEEADDSKENEAPAASSSSFSSAQITQANKYLDSQTVYNRAKMEAIPALAGVWDALNTYNVAFLTKRQADLHSGVIDKVLKALAKQPRKGSYNGDGDFDITRDKYVTKMETPNT